MRNDRKFKNYILDRDLQFKYVGYIVLSVAVVACGLGLLLQRATGELVQQSEMAVQLGHEAVTRGKSAISEHQKVNAVVEMTILQEPAYRDSPELLKAFQSEAELDQKKIISDQKELEEEALALSKQGELLRKQQARLGFVLLASLVILVLVSAAVGIVLSHKIAGPLYKMRRELSRIASGRLSKPPPLRRGDELVTVFEALESMVSKLQERQLEYVQHLDRILIAETLERDELITLREQLVRPISELKDS